MRLTVLGCGPASPQPDTPASGLLVESEATTILLDCGQGVAGQLLRRMEPARLSAVIIGHMHADHFIDLSALRYRFNWGERTDARLPVLLPPGGRTRFAELAAVVSERRTFFDDAFEVREYDPAVEERIGTLSVAYLPGRHYVPAWGVAITDPAGRRIVYAGDTGPNPDLIEPASEADLLVLEATLTEAAEDDPVRRGHLTLDEALEHATAARAQRTLITHYPSARRAAMEARLKEYGGSAVLARPDLSIEIAPPGIAEHRYGRGSGSSQPSVRRVRAATRG